LVDSFKEHYPIFSL
jgi:Ca2+ transporting ATPase